MKVAWGSGRLLFGRMYEDVSVELEVMPENGRIFCVASAGCTALALARSGRAVTAVDVNPAQVEYVRARAGGAPPRDGTVDRLLSALRALAPLAGWTPVLIRRFVALDETAEQLAFWRSRLDTRRFRAALATVLRPLTLRSIYAGELVASLPARFDTVLRRRLERGFGTHANRTNPYVRQLLLGERALEAGPADVAVHCADAAAFLEAVPLASFDGLSLSNVLDGATPAYCARLAAAASRAAAPGAVIVVRTLAEPASPEEDAWAVRDRSFLWGAIRVTML